MNADLSLMGHLLPYIASAYGISFIVIALMIISIARDFYRSCKALKQFENALSNTQQAHDAGA